MTRRAASIALEIVGAGGAAQIGPTAHAPVIDETRVAHEGLEALCLAYRSVLRRP